MSPSTSGSERPSARDARRARWELGALAGSVLVWFAAERLGLKFVALGVLLVAWIAWILHRARTEPRPWHRWGLRIDNARLALAWHGSAAAAGVALLALAGWLLGNLDARPLWIVLALYPLWALVQQFVLQDLLVADLQVLGVPRRLLPLAAALGFGAAHLPDLPLFGLTASAGFVLTWLWLRVPNLWTLALSHAILGTSAFLWVLGRDPAEEFPGLATFL